MAGLNEFYCRSNETSLGSQFKWLEYTFEQSLGRRAGQLEFRAEEREFLLRVSQPELGEQNHP